jgi:hypothetical protein
LPGDLRADLLEGSEPQSLLAHLDWVERERIGFLPDTIGAQFPTVTPIDSATAHEVGYLTARRVRTELLDLPSDSPIRDLAASLVGRMGWARECSRVAAGEVRLDGMVGLDKTTGAPLLLTSGRRGGAAERFRLARAAFYPVTRSLGSGVRLLNASVTPAQRAGRAFATELLAPVAALAKRVSGRLDDEDVERLASEFQVSPRVIVHQVENHGLGYVES